MAEILPDLIRNQGTLLGNSNGAGLPVYGAES